MTMHSSREFTALAGFGEAEALPRQTAPRPVNPVSHHPAGGQIYAQGDRAGRLYEIRLGAVRLYHLLADGRRQIAAFCLPGEVFGFAADTHYFFAEAIEETDVVVRQEAQAPTEERLALALESLVSAQTHLLVLGRQSACERIASFLLDMAARQGSSRRVELPMSRADVADYLGLTVETVSRGLSRMKDEGILRLNGARSIEFLKPQVLRDMIE